MESKQLLTESEVFKDEILAGTEGANNPSQEVPEPHDHDKNLIGTPRIELAPKSFILREQEVLTRHTGII